MLWCQGAQNTELSNHELKSALACTVWSQCTTQRTHRALIIHTCWQRTMKSYRNLKTAAGKYGKAVSRHDRSRWSATWPRDAWGRRSVHVTRQSRRLTFDDLEIARRLRKTRRTRFTLSNTHTHTLNLNKNCGRSRV